MGSNPKKPIVLAKKMSLAVAKPVARQLAAIKEVTKPTWNHNHMVTHNPYFLPSSWHLTNGNPKRGKLGDWAPWGVDKRR